MPARGRRQQHGRASSTAQQQDGPPTHSSTSGIVQRLYAHPMCLKDAICFLANGFEDMQQLLARPGDTPAYTDAFLAKTVVAFESVPPTRQQAWRLSQRFSQEQVGPVCQAGKCCVPGWQVGPVCQAGRLAGRPCVPGWLTSLHL